MSTPTVYVIRHGSTDLNLGGSGKDAFRGWLDVPLSEKGIREADKLARRLKDEPISAIYSSDLQRTMSTGKVIHENHSDEEKHPIPVIGMREFRPWNLGRLEGQPTTRQNIEKVIYHVKHPKDRLPGGEAFQDFVRRATDGLQEVLAGVGASSGKHASIIITHARNIQLAELFLQDGEVRTNDRDHQEALAAEPDSVVPGGYVKLELQGESWKPTERWPELENHPS